jgi:hypothetical protein
MSMGKEMWRQRLLRQKAVHICRPEELLGGVGVVEDADNRTTGGFERSRILKSLSLDRVVGGLEEESEMFWGDCEWGFRLGWGCNIKSPSETAQEEEDGQRRGNADS